jgi:hypothetical protein
MPVYELPDLHHRKLTNVYKGRSCDSSKLGHVTYESNGKGQNPDTNSSMWQHLTKARILANYFSISNVVFKNSNA